MAYEIIIGILILLVILVILYKVVKSITKALFITALIGVVALIGVGFFLVRDIQDFRDNFPTKPSLFIFEKDEEIVAAFAGAFGSQDSSPKMISSSELSKINSNYKSGDLDNILEDNYKVFIIKESFFEPLSSFDVGGYDISKKQGFDLLDSETAVDDYIDLITEDGTPAAQKSAIKANLMESSGIDEDTGFKDLIFAIMFSTMNQQEGPASLVKGLKTDDVTVYKKTITFKLLGSLPGFLVERLVQQGE